MIGRWMAWALAAVAVSSGCAGTRAERARTAYVREAMESATIPVSCDDLWPEALKLLAREQYDLVGNDREVAGQSSQGFIARFVSAGHQTTKDDRGVLEVATDWNRDRVRIQLTATPDGSQRCRVRATGYKEDLSGVSQGQWRDHDLEFALLERVAPAEAERIEKGAAEAAKR